MSERRMFAKTIVDSDAFLEMPLSTQALYFHLSMRADDDGFLNNPRKIQKMVGSSDDDLKLLIAKNFLLPFESGVVVIKHWRIHNYIRGDRKKDTVYQEELSQLSIKDNGAYTLCQPSVGQLSDNCHTQVSIGKDSIGKDSIYITHLPNLNYVRLKKSQYEKLNKDYPNINIDDMILKLDEYVTINGNKNKYKEWNLVLRKAIREEWFEKYTKTSLNKKKESPMPDWYGSYVKELNNQKNKNIKTDESIENLAKGLFDD